MTVTVGGNPATVSFGTLTIEGVPIGTEVPIQFTASQELLGSQFGLTDPADQIRAVVTGEERGPDGETVLASGQGAEVEFQFDIGAFSASTYLPARSPYPTRTSRRCWGA